MHCFTVFPFFLKYLPNAEYTRIYAVYSYFIFNFTSTEYKTAYATKPFVLLILSFPFSHPTRKPVVNVLDGVLDFLLVQVRSSFKRRACFNVRCEL